MSRRVLLVISLLWLGLWGMGAGLFFHAGTDKLKAALYIAQALTPVVRGADVRLEGVVEAGPMVQAPVAHKPCVAAVTRVYYVTTYEDAEERVQQSNTLITTIHTGSLALSAGDARVSLPLAELTMGASESYGQIEALPAELNVPAEAIAAAKARASGTFLRYAIEETTFSAGEPLFVVASVVDGQAAAAGILRLAPNRELRRLEVSRGTQHDAVERTRGSGAGLQIAGWIFLGLGALPFAGWGVWAARKRKPA